MIGDYRYMALFICGRCIAMKGHLLPGRIVLMESRWGGRPLGRDSATQGCPPVLGCWLGHRLRIYLGA